MKSFFRLYFFVLPFLLVVKFLVGCQAKEGISPNPQHLPVPPSNSNPKADGTSDTGGGNGVMEKVYESYAKNPYLFPAYGSHLEKLFNNLEKALPRAGFKAWIIAKTWYIAPVELKKIDKEILGLSFIDTETEQLAVQKPNSIWIKKEVFDRMDSESQADLILHEYVMIMYLMKFKPYSTICKMINSGSCQTLGSLDKLWPAEPDRPLNERDYENIRSVTAWLKDRRDADEIKMEDLKSVFLAKEFDARFLNPRDAKTEKPVIISPSEFFKIIQAPALAGNPLANCTAEQTVEIECQVQVTPTDIHLVNVPMAPVKGFNIEIKNRNGEKKSVNFTFGNDVKVQYTMTYKGTDYWTAFGVQMEDQFKTGDPANIVIFILTHSTLIQETPFELQRIFVKPGVITSIDIKRDNQCLVQKVKPTSFATQSLVIHRQDHREFWEQYLYESLVPTAACGDMNVIDEK